MAPQMRLIPVGLLSILIALDSNGSDLKQLEPKWNEGIEPIGMDEFSLWGLKARWIKEGDEVDKLCFFYMKRFVTCTKIPK